MGNIPSGQSDRPSPESKKYGKKVNGMHIEEIRMNRDLIKEIQEMKQKER